MAHYRTKIVEVEAVRFIGDNWDEIHKFAGLAVHKDNDNKDNDGKFTVYDKLHHTWIPFYIGNYIIKGLEDEFYPCVASTFIAKYEPI
jgi:hypothetical protein